MVVIDILFYRDENNKICFFIVIVKLDMVQSVGRYGVICLCMLLCNGLWNVCMVDIFIDFVNIRMLIGVCDMECYVVMGWD